MASRSRFSKHVVLRRIFGIVLFALLSALLLQDWHVRYLMKTAANDSRDIERDLLNAAWWLSAAWFASTALRDVSHRFLFPHDDLPKRRKLLADLVTALIYLIALFGILQFALHQPLSGMLATSGVVAIVLGLAMQNTFSDLFAGIALNIERPFRAGDWITSDGGNEGQVLEINWRATRIRDRNGDLVVIPNSLVAKQRVINHNVHGVAHIASIIVALAPGCSPDAAEQKLIDAALKAGYVLAAPDPQADIIGITPGAITYSVSFYVAHYAESPLAQSAVLKQICHLAAQGELVLARALADVTAAQVQSK